MILLFFGRIIGCTFFGFKSDFLILPPILPLMQHFFRKGSNNHSEFSMFKLKYLYWTSFIIQALAFCSIYILSGPPMVASSCCAVFALLCYTMQQPFPILVSLIFLFPMLLLYHFSIVTKLVAMVVLTSTSFSSISKCLTLVIHGLVSIRTLVLPTFFLLCEI